MNNNTYESLMINLKIISKIPQNGRISRNYNINTSNVNNIILETNNTVLLPFKRLYYGDSRYTAIQDINNIINNTMEYIKEIEINSFDIKIKQLLHALENTMIGINNLKITYSNDITISSKIDILLQKIVMFLSTYDSKFKSLLSFSSDQSKQQETLPDLQMGHFYV